MHIPLQCFPVKPYTQSYTSVTNTRASYEQNYAIFNILIQYEEIQAKKLVKSCIYGLLKGVRTG